MNLIFEFAWYNAKELETKNIIMCWNYILGGNQDITVHN
jgi:hypothetical protein